MDAAVDRHFNPQVPAHVPADLVVDFDVYFPGNREGDVLAVYAEMQAAGVPDVFWTRHNGGHWVVTRSDYMRELFADTETFSSTESLVPTGSSVPKSFLPIMSDPPEHTEYRRIIQRFFSPVAIREIAGTIRAETVGLIEAFQGAGHCEFCSEFAMPLPVRMFLHLVNLPIEDSPKLLAILAPLMAREADMADGLAAFRTYLSETYIERRDGEGKDVLSSVAKATFLGRPLTEAEFYAIASLLLLAGLDSTTAMLTLFATFLANNPVHRQQLVDDPSLIPAAVEEMLRRFPTSLPGPCRLVARDAEFHGVQLRRGELIESPRPFANLDARVFPRPMEVMFDRPNKNMHQTFGTGVHACIGSFLARTELRIFLEEWTKRIPQFEIKPGFEVEFITGLHLMIHELPLVWDVLP